MSCLHELVHRQRLGPWQNFRAQPYVFLARMLYSWHKPIPAMPLTSPIAIVCISDTHNTQTGVPDGDILIHAGDLTQSGSFQELQDALDWLRALPHPIKIVIAGNHELLLDSAWDDSSGRAASGRAQLDWGDITYRKNENTESANADCRFDCRPRTDPEFHLRARQLMATSPTSSLESATKSTWRPDLHPPSLC
ncbi:hypothetical protein N7448_005994 [Penicillium atrosanguineum]|nr:hypothetical protein N7448_005994 [Penicillium atrosanguineum]